MTDASYQLVETATYCKPNDEYRPGLVGLPDFTTTVVCPEDGTDPEEVTTAYPDGWYVRVMFDELLDPSIEELTPILDETGQPSGSAIGSIATAHPFELQCRSSISGEFVNVDYDGYYSPSGNRVTWPVGPSLVIKPNDPKAIGTNADCQITLNANITDKDGNPVPADQRGPFPFKTAPITAIVSDPPVDDPDFASPIDALTVWSDNFYIQFNTAVDINSICPDEDGDGNCDDESVFSIKDVAHPDEGPGLCNITGAPCGTVAECDTGGGDTLCGRGICGVSGDICNTIADCSDPDDHCNTNYAYDYTPYGLTDTEFGLGPIFPVETDHQYIFQFTEGAVLRDRCGRETTLAAASPDDLTLAHFVTNPFDFNGATIVTGEIPSAMKRLQWNFNNVLEGAIDSSDASMFTVSPTPKELTADCPGSGGACPTADLAASDLIIDTADGQMMLQGHLQLDTEYTATIKAGTVVRDFYGVEYTFGEDLTITWKTQPSILMTGTSARNTGALVGVSNSGTLVKTDNDVQTDFRFNFNASIDPTTWETTDAKLINADTGEDVPFTVNVSGCGSFTGNPTGSIGACSVRIRTVDSLPAGTYTATIVAGAEVKDIFGATYTQAADQSITITVADPPAPIQCL